jgi:hypothetical protein
MSFDHPKKTSAQRFTVARELIPKLREILIRTDAQAFVERQTRTDITVMVFNRNKNKIEIGIRRMRREGKT